MHPRRPFLQLAFGVALRAGAVLLAGAGLQAAAQPRYTVTAEQLQEVVAQRFPLRYPVAGLLDLGLQAPRLRLLPETNRLSAEMAVEAAGPALRRAHSGTFEVEFALRYEASDRTLRAHQLRLGRLDFPDLQPAAVELLNRYAPALAAQSLREVVLHTLRPHDLALFDGLGLQPGPITVTPRGLVVEFVPRNP